MYMSNRSKYAKYNIDDFPPNYSGQYTRESMLNHAKEPDMDNTDTEKINIHIKHSDGDPDENKNFKEPGESKEKKEEFREKGEKEDKEKREEKSEKKNGSLLGNIFGGNKDGKDGKKGGLLSGLFGGRDGKDGGILAGIELEDLILLAVIFFLLKDGFEDDLIIILAIILLSQ